MCELEESGPSLHWELRNNFESAGVKRAELGHALAFSTNGDFLAIRNWALSGGQERCPTYNTGISSCHYFVTAQHAGRGCSNANAQVCLILFYRFIIR